jgi:hypothetical protein
VALQRAARLLIAQAQPAPGGCLLCTRRPSQPKRRPQVTVAGRSLIVYRLVWEAAHGPIPPGLGIHHECEQKRCLNVAHMRLVSSSEHQAIHHRKEACATCHTRYTVWNEKGWGICQVCNRASSARYRQRKRR